MLNTAFTSSVYGILGYMLTNQSVTCMLCLADITDVTNSRIAAHEIGHNFGMLISDVHAVLTGCSHWRLCVRYTDASHDSTSDPVCSPSGNGYVMSSGVQSGSNAGTSQTRSCAVVFFYFPFLHPMQVCSRRAPRQPCLLMRKPTEAVSRRATKLP